MSGDDEPGTEAEAAGNPPRADDPKALARQTARKQSYDKLRVAFWRRVLADPVGRREMWEIIGVSAHAFETRFACGPNGFPQVEATWSALGEQMLGQRLFQTLQRDDFEGAWLMLAENDSRFTKPERKP